MRTSTKLPLILLTCASLAGCVNRTETLTAEQCKASGGVITTGQGTDGQLTEVCAKRSLENEAVFAKATPIIPLVIFSALAVFAIGSSDSGSSVTTTTVAE